MVWYAVERKKDGKLGHPADGEAWKTMDAKYPEFSSEPRNVRLGIATDGFNPFRKMSATHSTWPIVVVNYNLPPWLNMKPENLILSTIIPGPYDMGNNIDVYMQPLIEELKELWKTGVETYDAATNHKFTLRASVLLTISDFPGYAMMSGWSIKGKLACLVFHYETSSMYLKHNKKLCYMNHQKFLDPNHKWRFDKRRFNGEVETRTSAPMLTGRQVTEILDDYENFFGGDNLTRHNLDVMHIEKNICDSVLGTLLNIGGKMKDHLAARFKPEGSIAEGYLAHECLTFCARFLNDDQNKSVNESPSVNAEKGGYAIDLGKCKYGKDINLGKDTWIVAHRKHHKLLGSNLENIVKSKWYKTEKTRIDAVCEWLRPRSSPFKVVEKNIDKRTFVTLKDINNEKERRKSTRKKLKFNTYHDVSSKYQQSPTGVVEPSPKAAVEPNPKAAVEPSPKCAVEKSPEVIVKDIDGSGTGAGQITFLESGGSREMLKEVEGDGCNDYEMRRNKNVAKNKAKLQALGLSRTKPASETEKCKAKQPNEDGAESDYIPDNDHELVNKVTMMRMILANKLVEESQNKEPTMGSPDHVDEINETPVLTAKEKLQALKYGPSSMVAYNELRKCEKLGIQKEIPELESGTKQVISESGDTSVGEARKRKRGRTKMNHFHNSTKKKVITLNDQFQPVFCGGKWSVAEFSNFLGTTLRRFMSLTCASWHQVPEKELLWEYVKDKYIIPEEAKSWVFTTLSDQFRSTKSRIKRNYYSKYATDEERLKHRPRDVSLEDWKIFLTYWGDGKVQLLERLDKLPVGIDDDEMEELLKVSDADVYLETHKRDDKRSYKLLDEMAKVVNEKIAKVQKTL
ncbi:hypothetical protein AgCh_004366 [Apium graveolens]